MPTEPSKRWLTKLDVQDTEDRVLRGAQTLLRGKAIAVIFTEGMFVPHYEGGVLYQVVSFLEALGCSLYNFFDHATGTKWTALLVQRDLREQSSAAPNDRGTEPVTGMGRGSPSPLAQPRDAAKRIQFQLHFVGG